VLQTTFLADRETCIRDVVGSWYVDCFGAGAGAGLWLCKHSTSRGILDLGILVYVLPPEVAESQF
jgi:hypothetical protein